MTTQSPTDWPDNSFFVDGDADARVLTAVVAVFGPVFFFATCDFCVTTFITTTNFACIVYRQFCFNFHWFSEKLLDSDEVQE